MCDSSTSNPQVVPQILVFGNSGAGKSSLINSIFQEKVARTEGFSSSVTEEFENYDLKVNGKLVLRVLDSKGMEIGNACVDVMEKLKKVCETTQIHIVYYVIDSTQGRIEVTVENLCQTVFSKMKVFVILSKADLQSCENIKKLKEVVISKKIENVEDVYVISNTKKYWKMGFPRYCKVFSEFQKILSQLSSSKDISKLFNMEELEKKCGTHQIVDYDQKNEAIYCHSCQKKEKSCIKCETPKLRTRGLKVQCGSCKSKWRVPVQKTEHSLLMNTTMDFCKELDLVVSSSEVFNGEYFDEVIAKLIEMDYNEPKGSEEPKEDEDVLENEGKNVEMEESSKIPVGDDEKKEEQIPYEKLKINESLQGTGRLMLKVLKGTGKVIKSGGKVAGKAAVFLVENAPKIMEVVISILENLPSDSSSGGYGGTYMEDSSDDDDDGGVNQRFYSGGQFTPGGGRAKAGGELHLTDKKYYKGGQFIPGGGRAKKGGEWI